MQKFAALWMIALMLLSVCAGCKAKPEPEEEIIGMPNPMHEMSADELYAKTGMFNGVPQEIKDAKFFYIDMGEDAGISQASFSYNGDEYCFRAKSGAKSDEDLSGLYYDWPQEDVVHIAGCTSKMNDKGQGYVSWLADEGLYSLSMSDGCTAEKLTAMQQMLLAVIPTKSA